MTDRTRQSRAAKRGQVKSRSNPTVTVIGAGIAGMTAAQELAERGFHLAIVESARNTNGRSGDAGTRTGGMAATAYHSGRTVFKFTPKSPSPPARVRFPGEYGFRFVPGYFIHLRDALRRIPLRGGQGSVFDNLVASPTATALDSSAKLSPKDLLIYMLRLLRYMSTSSGRRAAECEDLSLSEYLQGLNRRGDNATVSYGAGFAKALLSLPKLFSAIDAEYADARTEMNVAAQLLSAAFGSAQSDAVLNGPASESWFLHWRTHLHQLGVSFHSATLETLRLDRGEVVAAFSRNGRRWNDAAARSLSNSDYIVLATDVIAAEQTTASLPATGVPGALRGYTTSVRTSPTGSGDGIAKRDPIEHSGLTPWDRMRSAGSIQFFFREPIDIEPLQLSVGDSPWGLAAIAHHRFWADPPTLARDGYVAVLSVDIFNWRTPGLNGHPPAAASTRQQIAHEVWRQLRTAIADLRGSGCSDPAWFTLEANIPFPVAVMSDWQRRPNGEPARPAADGGGSIAADAKRGLWQAGHGGYLVHWHKLVFAGSYMRTFSRTANMEAACESGRHAVNAILAHRALGAGDGAEPPAYCSVWNVEDEESPHLRFARHIDGILFGQTRPHPWQQSRIDDIVAWLSQSLGDSGAVDSVLERVAALFKGQEFDANADTSRHGGAATDYAAALLQLQRFREELERLIKRAGAR